MIDSDLCGSPAPRPDLVPDGVRPYCVENFGHSGKHVIRDPETNALIQEW